MPRAFCPECGSEVPVDADGVCHVGHHVDLDAATPGGPSPASDDPDEPQPWVASVDSTTLGGFTPPPGDAAAGAGQPADADAGGDRDAGGDDLAAAAAAAAASVQPEAPGPDPVEGSGEQVEAGWPGTLPSEGEAPGWTPPTNDPVAPPPVPSPAPADPPAPASAADDDDLSAGDFDLDDLAAAVSDLDMDDAAPPASPERPAPAPTAPVPAPTADAPDAEDAPAHEGWEDDLGEPGEHAGATTGAGGDAEPVDLANFTAKSGKVKTGDGGGRKGGLFRRK